MFLNWQLKTYQPEWFTQALQQEAERLTHSVAGADIEILAWGERGKPGVLFLHGMLAHAHWWSFITPFFCKDYRVAAISWSGMGGSGHRPAYDLDTFVEEARACANAAGLFDSKVAPRVVAHSFGAFVASRLAELHGGEFAGIVLLDLPLRTPEQRQADAVLKGAAPKQPPREKHEARSLQDALSRFRLRPEQPADNGFIVDYIARNSLKKVAPNATGNEQWTWKFDPKVLGNAIGNPARSITLAKCPLAFVWGADSKLVGEEVLTYFKESVRDSAPPMFAIPSAQHHVMIDQPLALAGALRGLFAAWPREPERPLAARATTAALR